MSHVIRHRGPDDAGTFVEGSIALGHRRLSIVDVSGGHQPMCNEDGSLQIVFNGEIYNHMELRKDLETRGHRYETRCDTETIIHLFEERGADCVRELRGMFAFAIWDRQRNSLFCARDRLGIKPFYYTVAQGRLLFASEIKALLEAPEVERRINRKALPEHIAFGYLSGPETLFEDIYKLLPGHWLLCEGGRIITKPYWSLPLTLERTDRSASECVEQFRDLFIESVKLRLMSDVPLGAFLSGGLDSSAVVSVMSEFAGQNRVKTFSVGYSEQKYSELGFARQVAKYLGTEHREVILDRAKFFSLLPKLIWHEDEPVVWPSSVSLYSVSQLASEHVKVVLTGEGSDELLAGYSRYWATLWNVRLGRGYWNLLPQAVQRGVRNFLDDSYLPTGFSQKLRHSFLYHSSSFEDVYFGNFVSNFSTQEVLRLLSADGSASRSEIDPYRTALHISSEPSDGDFLTRLLYTDMKTYLVELLMKQDNMSMATSIESRVPFLDHKLVEAVWGMPSSVKLRGIATKYLLRKMAAKRLPPVILNRPKKGFPTPLRGWMSEQYSSVRSILTAPRARKRETVVPRAVDELLSIHESGKRDCTFQLWRLLNLELWCRIFFDRDGSEEIWADDHDSFASLQVR